MRENRWTECTEWIYRYWPRHTRRSRYLLHHLNSKRSFFWYFFSADRSPLHINNVATNVYLELCRVRFGIQQKLFNVAHNTLPAETINIWNCGVCALARAKRQKEKQKKDQTVRKWKYHPPFEYGCLYGMENARAPVILNRIEEKIGFYRTENAISYVLGVLHLESNWTAQSVNTNK